jgi:hypothetical protein
MHRDIAITFNDLIGKLDVLRVSCEKCGREGSYPLNGLIDRRGRDGKVIDWLDEVTAECPNKIAHDTNDPCEARCLDLPRAAPGGRVLRHDALLFLLVPLFVIVVAALLLRETKLLSSERKSEVTAVEAPVAKENKADNAGPHEDQPNAKRSLTPACEKELRRMPELLRFFANRIQTGEDAQSVVNDMRLQEKKISAVCTSR